MGPVTPEKSLVPRVHAKQLPVDAHKATSSVLETDLQVTVESLVSLLDAPPPTPKSLIRFTRVAQLTKPVVISVAQKAADPKPKRKRATEPSPERSAKSHEPELAEEPVPPCCEDANSIYDITLYQASHGPRECNAPIGTLF